MRGKGVTKEVESEQDFEKKRAKCKTEIPYAQKRSPLKERG